MMSMSGGWFFVGPAKPSARDATWKLPGIGSYVALALEQRDIAAVLYAILAMLVVILAYDQLLFRPLVAWSAKFRNEMTAGRDGGGPVGAEAVAPDRRCARSRAPWARCSMRSAGCGCAGPAAARLEARTPSVWGDRVFMAVLVVALGAAGWVIATFAADTLTLVGPARGAASGADHAAAGRRADGAGDPGVGADRGMAGVAAEMGTAGDSRLRSSWRRPGQPVLPGVRPC